MYRAQQNKDFHSPTRVSRALRLHRVKLAEEAQDAKVFFLLGVGVRVKGRRGHRAAVLVRLMHLAIPRASRAVGVGLLVAPTSKGGVVRRVEDVLE